MPISPPSTWERPRWTLIIASAPRSGSNFLCGKLRSTGVLGNPTEYFQHWDRPDVTTPERCLLAAEKGRTDNGVVAFKLFPDHFDRLQKDIRLSKWFPDPVWVHLERRDLLGQAISLARAMQDGIWSSDMASQKDAIYSKRAIEASLAKIVANNGRWTSYFARTGIEPFRVSYEDIREDVDSVCQEIGMRLGLDALVPATGDVHFQQQRNAQNDEWRRRFLDEAGDQNSFPTMASGSRKRGKSKWAFWKK